MKYRDHLQEFAAFLPATVAHPEVATKLAYFHEEGSMRMDEGFCCLPGTYYKIILHRMLEVQHSESRN